jgi:hypothetical protein
MYCHLFALLNLYTAWEGLKLARDPHGVIGRSSYLQQQAADEQTTQIVVAFVQWAGWSLVGVGLVFGLAALTLPHAPDNRKTWIAHLVHICFGATSCVLAPLCVPLLIAWFRPEVKGYFGVESQKSKVE